MAQGERSSTPGSLILPIIPCGPLLYRPAGYGFYILWGIGKGKDVLLSNMIVGKTLEYVHIMYNHNTATLGMQLKPSSSYNYPNNIITALNVIVAI